MNREQALTGIINIQNDLEYLDVEIAKLRKFDPKPSYERQICKQLMTSLLIELKDVSARYASSLRNEHDFQTSLKE